MRRHHDDDNMLRDGDVGRVPLMLRDAMTPLQRSVAEHAARSRVTDADGGLTGLHRPGYRVTSDAEMRDVKQRARDEYEHELHNAWRGDARRKKTVERDPEGRLLSEEEEEIDDALPPVRDGRTLDQIRHHHQVKMAAIYDLHDAEQREMWRRKP
jgi:hypothetical protein